MKTNIIQYPQLITKGQTSAVLITIKEWNHIQFELKSMKNKLDEIENIRSGLKDVTLSRKGKKKLQTLKSFLHEN